MRRSTCSAPEASPSDDAGKAIPYKLGQYTSLGYYGTGDQTTPGMGFAELEVPVKRYATFGHAYFDFNDSVRGWTELAVNHVNGDTLQSVFYGAARPIYADNRSYRRQCGLRQDSARLRSATARRRVLHCSTCCSWVRVAVNPAPMRTAGWRPPAWT
ncbi:MAG: hypothetical protein WDO12_13170 [Pseudomonadota bacterium]